MTKIHLLGDSLVQTRMAFSGRFYCGWGDMLAGFMDAETEILNYALGGRSSRSFLNEGRFYDNGNFTKNQAPYNMGPALPRISKGDYVFIHFMGNDDTARGAAYRYNKQVTLGEPDAKGIYPTVVPTPSMLSPIANWQEDYVADLQAEGYSEDAIRNIVKTTEELLLPCGEKFYSFDCGATYKGYLKYYVDASREKGAIPVLFISGARFSYEDGKVRLDKSYHGIANKFHDSPYEHAVRQLGEELDVPVVDVATPETALYKSLGVDRVQYLHNMSVSQNDVANIDATDPFGTPPDPSGWLSEIERRWMEKDFLTLDSVHKNHFGAYVSAAIIADQLYDMDILRPHIRPVSTRFPGMPKPLEDCREKLAAICKYVKMFA